ncbi:MAG: F0F1 ATP synthase subunit epsilon [Bifidobacteriaceae bacterium]|jgi:F-type H+-transporting ATPase subunit epsilon|nr:F0F1 ATP synthase subunit epsilon [Bifidobacteriaceae bacterium]
MADERLLTVEIADWEGQVWAGQGTFLTAPTVEGSVGIYPRHEPFLALLGNGEVKVDLPAGGAFRATVAGGFFSVDSDIVTIVTDDATVVE